METERYCDNLDALLLENLVCAIHQAWLQQYCEHYDNGPAIARVMADCLKQAGHIGFAS